MRLNRRNSVHCNSQYKVLPNDQRNYCMFQGFINKLGWLHHQVLHRIHQSGHLPQKYSGWLVANHQPRVPKKSGLHITNRYSDAQVMWQLELPCSAKWTRITQNPYNEEGQKLTTHQRKMDHLEALSLYHDQKLGKVVHYRIGHHNQPLITL